MTEQVRDVLRFETPGLRVVLTGCQMLCTHCGQWKPASQVGLRKQGDKLRNQPQCSDCRSRYRLSHSAQP